MEGTLKSNISLKIRTMFRSLEHRNYRLFFAGQSISLIGTWMQRIALPWLVYHMTGSAFLLGLVGFAGQIPTFLLSPVAGVVVDRFSRYKVLLITQILSLIQASILAALALTGVIQIWHIVILSVIFGCINAFDTPSRHSFVIEMVEKKESLGNAIALNSLMFNGARLIGPSIAGVMLATTGEGVCFLINAISYLFVIGSLLMMYIPKKEFPRKETKMLKELKEGFNYTFGFLPIKHIIILLAIINLMGSSYQVLMPVLVKEVLHGGSDTFGFLMAAAGFGALIGAAYLASRESVLRLGRIIPSAATVFGAGLVALAFTNIIPVTMGLMFIIGLGLMINTASCNTILQTITDDDMRGRVMSFYTMAIMGTAPFGSLLAGSLARLIGTQYTILIGGVSCIAVALVFYKKLPRLKTLVKPIYDRLALNPQPEAGIHISSQPADEAADIS
ncbi:MAG TPA: MFS transporter [Bacteroidales bacterium]|nr:MFS transporter [Bacteroidales bacterium]